MSINNNHKSVYWVIGVIAFCVLLYLISDILLPFVVGIFVAYFLDPVADKLEKKNISRTTATIIIIATFFLLLIGVMVAVLPVLADQLFVLASKIPLYTEEISQKLQPKVAGFLEKLDGHSIQKVQNALGDISGYFFNMIGKVLGNIWQSGFAVLNIVSLVLISPIVAFYMLRDWDKMIARVNKWLPRKSTKTIQRLAREIDDAVAGFIRGQGTVMILLGLFYAICLGLVGLDSALVIGLGTGLLTIIPYVGVIFGMAIGLSMAYLQFGDLLHLGLVGGVFIIGQFLEGNFITPKLVGERVGLHPVWVIFGMLAGGSLFGFVGILIAIPVTAIIGVLFRFAVEEYLKSSAYLGKK